MTAMRLGVVGAAIGVSLTLTAAIQFAQPGVAAAESTFTVYVVEPGDSLSAIADKSGTTVRALAEFNQIDDPDRVLPGRPLVIVTSSAAIRTEARAPEVRTQLYTVAPGDTLTDIAAQAGSDVATIARMNNLGDHDVIPVGMPLTVPSRAPTPAPRIQPQHVVQSGETASGIADRYGVSVSALSQVNQLRDPDRLSVGLLLDIPARALPVPPPHIVSALGRAAWDYGLDPHVLLGLAYLESGWQMDVVSSAGAIGVMQLMPDTARWAVDDLVLVATNWPNSLIDNTRVGAAFFAYLLTLANGDVAAALAGYYQGWTSVKTDGLFEETQQYINDVLALIERFRAMPAIF